MMTRLYARSAAFLAPAALACVVVAAPAFAADLAPEAVVQKAAGETLAAIKADKAMQSGDINRIIALVDTKVMPHVNFTRMTGTAVGPAWRTATADQKARLEKEFKTLLVRTYAGAFKMASDKELKILPMRPSSIPNEATVRSQLVGSSEPVPMDYRMEKTPGQGLGWKAYNMAISGVWMIEQYKDQYAKEINTKGIDGLIASIANKNKSLEANQKK